MFAWGSSWWMQVLCSVSRTYISQLDTWREIIGPFWYGDAISRFVCITWLFIMCFTGGKYIALDFCMMCVFIGQCVYVCVYIYICIYMYIYIYVYVCICIYKLVTWNNSHIWQISIYLSLIHCWAFCLKSWEGNIWQYLMSCINYTVLCWLAKKRITNFVPSVRKHTNQWRVAHTLWLPRCRDCSEK